MMNTEKVENDKRKRKAIPILLLFLIVIIIIIILVIICFLKTRKEVTSKETTPADTQIQDENTSNTEVKDTQLTNETPSCAPIYTGGEVTSSTNTDTTWSYYFSKATRESVLEYVENLKNNDWSTISEKTIVNTSFWDLQKDNCFISLRYHSTDGGVILEIREETD